MPLENFFKSVHKLFVEICWSHWKRLGAHVDGPMNRCSTDPEALIILTSLIGREDERLLEVMAQWIHHYERLIPIERMKSLLEQTPIEPETHYSLLNSVIHSSLHENQKARWKTVVDILKSASGSIEEIKNYRVESRKKLEDHEKIVKQNIHLTLRYIFGSGCRADAYYCLIVSHKARESRFHVLSDSQLASCLHYHRRSVNYVLNDFRDAHLIEKKKKSAQKILSAYDLVDGTLIKVDRTVEEKAYIDWLKIVFMLMSLKDLKRKIKGIQNKLIIKKRLHENLENLKGLVAEAYIPLVRSLPLDQPLKEIPIEDLTDSILKTIEGTYRFIIGPKGLP
ncbi:MAG TPA: hypothetical protein DDW49_02455 [Deltaproteobacteria bacterium]|nr:hypothetical protein [Deltaproteobacteria bacterium]